MYKHNYQGRAEPKKRYLYNCEGYTIEISFNYELSKLKEQWAEIEKKVVTPFFLSWIWISNWIQTYSPQLIIIKVKFQHEIVAIGLFTKSIEKRHQFITSRQLRLHQTGNNDSDQIWIEYNDFICTPEHDEKAVIASIHTIQNNIPDWDEIILSMTTEHRYKSFSDNSIQSSVTLIVPCYSVNLENIRMKSFSYLDTLSSNTRYQIRRSIKKYQQQFGELSLKFAENTQQALKFFHEAGPSHMKRWLDSGFKNNHFIRFHENLIKNHFAADAIDLIKVSAGDKTIAIIYNLISNNKVYFYLQGLNYETDKKLKPGLVAHSLIIQYYLSKGMNLYDFMGGYSQYKTQLASHSSDCYSLCIQRPKIKFALETMGKKLKRVLNKQN